MQVIRKEIVKAMVSSLQEAGVKTLLKNSTTEQEKILLRGVYEMLWQLDTMIDNYSFEVSEEKETEEA